GRAPVRLVGARHARHRAGRRRADAARRRAGDADLHRQPDHLRRRPAPRDRRAGRLTRVERRPLGRTGLLVSEVGVGTWELSGDVWGATDDGTSRAAVLAGLDAGANLIDTAADYGAGHVEELLGDLLADGSIRRDDVVLTT